MQEGRRRGMRDCQRVNVGEVRVMQEGGEGHAGGVMGMQEGCTRGTQEGCRRR